MSCRRSMVGEFPFLFARFESSSRICFCGGSRVTAIECSRRCLAHPRFMIDLGPSFAIHGSESAIELTMRCSPALALRLQSCALVRGVAALGSLIWLGYVKQAEFGLSQKFHRFRFSLSAVFLRQRQERFFLR